MNTTLLFLFASAASFGCTFVSGDRITGADLARADSRYANVSKEQVIGFAPYAGIQRAIEPRELTRIAKKYFIDTDGISPVCFERIPVDILKSKIAKAARGIDPVPAPVTIDVFDLVGRLEESHILGLLRPAEAAEVYAWSGSIEHEGQIVPVSALLRHMTELTWVAPVRSIFRGERLTEKDLEVRKEWGPITRDHRDAIKSMDQAVGKLSNTSLFRAMPITRSMLADEPPVQAAQPVSLEVRSGTLTLVLPAVATASGWPLDFVGVSLNGKKIQAQVIGKGRVFVDARNVRALRDLSNHAALRQK